MYHKWIQLQSLMRLMRNDLSEEAYQEALRLIERKLDETHPNLLKVHNRRIV